jgi:hypothetical protein
MERMMKLQDVLLKAMAKKISWGAAAEIIGISDRTMRRWHQRWAEHGYDGLMDRRKGKPSAHRVAVKDSGRSAAAVPGEVLRPEHAAFSREAEPKSTRSS